MVIPLIGPAAIRAVSWTDSINAAWDALVFFACEGIVRPRTGAAERTRSWHGARPTQALESAYDRQPRPSGMTLAIDHGKPLDASS